MPFYLKCRFCLFPKAKYLHLDTIFLSFTSLMTNVFIFRFFEPFSLNYDQNTLGYCFTERWRCQKIMPFLPKMPILLRPYKLKTYIYTFKIEIFSRPYFTNLMTGIFHFLMFWTFPSSSMIKTPWGIIFSVNSGVARKSMSFYLKCQFCLGLKLNT